MNRRLASTFLLAMLAASTGCASIPEHLDLGMKHATAHHAFVVELEPPATPPAINKIHSWRIRVADTSGAPVRHAQIGVDGGMPQHGHGLPTQPRVTRELADGTYLLEGMKFSMTGWWEIKLTIAAAGTNDTVTFNTIIESTPAGR